MCHFCYLGCICTWAPDRWCKRCRRHRGACKMFSFILLCISGGLKFLVWCCVFLIPTDDWLNNINIMAVTMEFNLTATFPLVAWKHIWSYELKLKKNKLGLTVGGLILRVICCLHCMISTLFLLQHFELQFHCSAASSQRVSSHFFKYLRCLFFFHFMHFCHICRLSMMKSWLTRNMRMTLR